MFFYHHVDAGLKTQDSKAIEPAENFRYLGSWISDSEQDSRPESQKCCFGIPNKETQIEVDHELHTL